MLLRAKGQELGEVEAPDAEAAKPVGSGAVQIVLGVMAVTAVFQRYFYPPNHIGMEAFMQFHTRELIARLTLALGVAATGIALFAAVALPHGAPI